MALIICPECGNEVSDMAPSCPKCGCPILVNTVDEMASNVEITPGKKKKTPSYIVYQLMCMTIIPLIIMVLQVSGSFGQGMFALYFGLGLMVISFLISIVLCIVRLKTKKGISNIFSIILALVSMLIVILLISQFRIRNEVKYLMSNYEISINECYEACESAKAAGVRKGSTGVEAYSYMLNVQAHAEAVDIAEEALMIAYDSGMTMAERKYCNVRMDAIRDKGNSVITYLKSL